MLSESTRLQPVAVLAIPCFREAVRLRLFLPSLLEALSTRPEVGVLVVDDGSGDREVKALIDLLEPLRGRFPALLAPILLANNQGKGAAVRAGWRWAMQQVGVRWLGFVDADGACSAAEVLRLYSQLDALPNLKVAILASRVRMLGRSVNRLWQRHVLGRIFATMVGRGLGIAAYDTQCGLKWLSRAAYQDIEARLSCDGFAFDVELIAALLDDGAEVIEIPVDWQEVPGGKVRLWRDSWHMALELWQIEQRRARWRLGLTVKS